MRNHPDVSLIVPIRNAAAYLPTCMESVLGQTLRDIEVICIDDGSTDSSGDIVREYARDGRVRVIVQSHCGTGVARNRAMEVATGEYVAFMDADDMYPSEDALERMVAVAQGERAAVCGGGVMTLRGQTLSVGAINTGPFETRPFTDRSLLYRDYQVDYGFQRFVYSRALLVNHAIRFPPYARFQDPPFFVRAMHAAVTFIGMSAPTYCHRRGHRKVEWSETQTVDMIRGIRDNLRFSARHCLARLHCLSVWRLREEYATIIQTASRHSLVAVRRAVEEAELAIERALLVLPERPRPTPEHQAISGTGVFGRGRA